MHRVFSNQPRFVDFDLSAVRAPQKTVERESQAVMPSGLIALVPDRCTLPAIDQDCGQQIGVVFRINLALCLAEQNETCYVIAPQPNSFRYFER